MTLIILILTGIISSSVAQNIPDEVADEASKIEQKLQAHKDSVWQAVKPIVMKQARNGRPYVPYASVPAHFQEPKAAEPLRLVDAAVTFT
ncbi:MAG TPA: hypothetical protein VK112_08060 [Fodinibius sp.]|nr:hypothetical protein [Fodinibius sp.]